MKSHTFEPLWMVLGAFLFATMAVFIKGTAGVYSAYEVVFYRGAVGVAFLWFTTRVRGVSLRTAVPGMHLWRSAVGVSSLLGWFYALSLLPLATAMTLNYMSSIWVATFLLGGALLLNSREVLYRQSPLFITVLLGFSGVVLVLRPSWGAEQAWGALAGLASGVTAALAYMQVTALSRVGEPDSRTVFYFSLSATAVGAVGMLGFGAHSLWDWHALLLLPIGLLAVLGQLCMTRAYASGATLLVANLQYSGIVFAALYGMLIFHDDLPASAWAGMAVIVVCGIAATVLRHRVVPDANPSEDH